MKRRSVKHLTLASLLVAMGIIIPMVMPKIVIGPASFTLASHVPLFLAMFFSPSIALAVSLGTAFGFFISATPIIALRALSHVLFAIIGASYLQKYPRTIFSNKRSFLRNGRFQLFNLIIGLIHSAAELVVISIFYTLGNLPATYYDQGYMYVIFLLMGFGGVIHSLIDYNIAYFLADALSKQFTIPVFSQAKKQAKENSNNISQKVKSLL